MITVLTTYFSIFSGAVSVADISSHVTNQNLSYVVMGTNAQQGRLIGDDEIYFQQPVHGCEYAGRRANVYQYGQDSAIEQYQDDRLIFKFAGPVDLDEMMRMADEFCQSGTVLNPPEYFQDNGMKWGIVKEPPIIIEPLGPQILQK